MILFLIYTSKSSDLAFAELRLKNVSETTSYLICVASEQAK